MKKRMRNGALIVVLLVAFLFWQNNDLVVTEHEVGSSKLPQSFDGFVIVQVSDLHNKEFGKGQKRLLELVKKQNPNMIVITGDVIDFHKTNVEITMAFINGAVEIAPVYYITGNHEVLSASLKPLMDRMEAAGVHILDDQALQLKNEAGDLIQLIGLDDLSLNNDTLGKMMYDLEEDVFTIILAHQPEQIGYYSTFGIDLVFSGHAHGGQIRLPIIGGLYAPNQGVIPKYTSGMYQVNDTKLIVSRGLGNSLFPFRVFNQPEIITVKLTHQEE